MSKPRKTKKPIFTIKMRDNKKTNEKLLPLCESLNVDEVLTNDLIQELKDRISDLEFERDNYKDDYESEQIRADEFSDKLYDAREEISDLEDKIAQYENNQKDAVKLLTSVLRNKIC